MTCSLSAEGAEAIADIVKRAHLKELNLYMNDIGDAGILKVLRYAIPHLYQTHCWRAILVACCCPPYTCKADCIAGPCVKLLCHSTDQRPPSCLRVPCW